MLRILTEESPYALINVYLNCGITSTLQVPAIYGIHACTNYTGYSYITSQWL